MNTHTAGADDAGTNHWAGSVSAGLGVAGGNTEDFQIGAAAETHRKYTVDEWKFGAGLTYGETTREEKNALGVNKDKTDVTTDLVTGFAQYNHLFTERFYVGARLDGLHDGTAELTYRLTLSPLAGYYFIKGDKTTLSGEAGPAFVLEKHYGKDATSFVALRLSERLEHKFNEAVKVWEQVDVFPQINQFEDYLVVADIGIQADLTKQLAWKTVFQDRYDNRPAAHTGKNDYNLLTSIVYKF